MEIKKISESDYISLYNKSTNPGFFQDVRFAKVQQKQNLKYSIYGGYINSKLVIANIVYFYPWRRIFKVAKLLYGPIQEIQNHNEMGLFYSSLLAKLENSLLVIKIEVFPNIKRNIYNDIKLLEACEVGQFIDNTLTKLGYNHLDASLEDSNHQICFSYVKDIANMNYDAIITSCNKSAKYELKKITRDGVLCRELENTELDVLKDILTATKERLGHGLVAFPRYINHLKEFFGDDVKFLLAYLDCDFTIAKYNSEIQEMSKEKSRLEELLSKNPNSKKTLNKLREINENIPIVEKRLNDVIKLKAKHGNTVNMSASIFICTKDEIFYLFSGSYSEFMKYSAVYANHSYMLKYAAQKKLISYNLYGISGDLTENAQDYGVLQFKRGFAGNVTELLGTYEKNVAGIFSKLV